MFEGVGDWEPADWASSPKPAVPDFLGAGTVETLLVASLSLRWTC